MLHTAAISRRAEPADIPSIRDMQKRSLFELCATSYTTLELQTFLDVITTMEDAVVDEGHYVVTLTPRGRIIASGGWSQRKPGYAPDHAVGDATKATVRSVFVDPDLAGHGFGKNIVTLIEADAARHGIRRLELAASLSSVPFYRARGYSEAGRPIVLELPNDVRFRLTSMGKNLPPHVQETDVVWA